MPSNDFLFALDLSDHASCDEMLDELARTVLEHVGCSSAAVPALMAEFSAALAGVRRHGPHRCRVQFIARAGKVAIVVDGGEEGGWRTERLLP